MVVSRDVCPPICLDTTAGGEGASAQELIAAARATIAANKAARAEKGKPELRPVGQAGVEGRECAICLGAMANATPFPNEACPHIYCAECLGRLRAHDPAVFRCPQCRRGSGGGAWQEEAAPRLIVRSTVPPRARDFPGDRADMNRGGGEIQCGCCGSCICAACPQDECDGCMACLGSKPCAMICGIGAMLAYLTWKEHEKNT